MCVSVCIDVFNVVSLLEVRHDKYKSFSSMVL